MTTIAAIQGDGWVVIGCESRTTLDGGRYMSTVSRKVVERDGLLIATAGGSRGANLLHYGWKAPKLPSDDTDLDVWFTATLIPSIREEFTNSGFEVKREDGESAKHGGDYLIAVRGQLYYLFEDYSWEKDANGLYVVGTGGELALGALEAYKGHKCKDPDLAAKIIRLAVAIAIKHDNNSGGDIHVYTQYAPQP